MPVEDWDGESVVEMDRVLNEVIVEVGQGVDVE